ncbi:MAG: hypothetical protein AAGF11_21580 [Myxococcota bacterium]
MLDNSRRRGFEGLATGLVTIALACEPNLRPEMPDVEPVEPVERSREPVAVVEGEASRNLLQGYIERDPDVAGRRKACPPAQPLCDEQEKINVPVTWEEESQSWRLPYQAKRIVAALMIAAAHDRLDSLRFILTPDAQWGWPDPRRPGARPVFTGDQGEAFFKVLRKVGQRLPEKTKWTSHPVPPGVQMLLSTGAEPMWTYYSEGPDGILMRLVVYGGKARIDYVGLFDELPAERPNADAYGPPPPMKTPLRPPPAPSAKPQP